MNYITLSTLLFLFSLSMLIFVSWYKFKDLKKTQQPFLKKFLSTSWSEVFLSTFITILLTFSSGLFFYEFQKRNAQSEKRQLLIAYLNEVISKRPKGNRDKVSTGYINEDIIHSLNDQGNPKLSIELIKLEEYIKYFHLFHNEMLLYTLSTNKEISPVQKQVIDQAQNIMYFQAFRIKEELESQK